MIDSVGVGVELKWVFFVSCCELGLGFRFEMALQTATPPTTPSAQVVGNAFVEQYYHILHHSPDLVYRFYQDSSVISRPDSNGVMTSVTTMKGINEKILSLNFKEFKAEIKTADAQKSHKEGVTVLVTGCLTGKDNMKRKFAQYVEDHEPSELPPVNEDGDASAVTVTPEPGKIVIQKIASSGTKFIQELYSCCYHFFTEPSHVADSSASDPENSHANKVQTVAENAYEPSNHHERQILVENEDNVESHFQSNGNDDSQATELASSAQEDAPKQSYASIVKVQKGSPGPTKVYVPTNTVKPALNNTESQVIESVESAEVPEAALDSVNNPESSDAQEEVEGHSIYIRNLPLNVTVAQLEVEFMKFGPIKPGGIQVRYNKQQGYCFGFVEFLSLNSMNSAIQASPITVGGCQAVVEIKRTTTRVGSGTISTGRPRIPPGRSGLRNDSFRGRGNYGGGRGYGRNDYGSRGGDFSGRGRGPGGHGEGYHQGRGRGGRSSAQKQNTLVSN
ncbi:Ras GTPase-activating protein-binding protein 1, partial [Mucuna pruriens]